MQDIISNIISNQFCFVYASPVNEIVQSCVLDKYKIELDLDMINKNMRFVSKTIDAVLPKTLDEEIILQFNILINKNIYSVAELRKQFETTWFKLTDDKFKYIIDKTNYKKEIDYSEVLRKYFTNKNQCLIYVKELIKKGACIDLDMFYKHCLHSDNTGITKFLIIEYGITVDQEAMCNAAVNEANNIFAFLLDLED